MLRIYGVTVVTKHIVNSCKKSKVNVYILLTRRSASVIKVGVSNV